MKNFSWQTPEYVQKEKTADWYWTVGIIASAFVVTAVIFGNFLFGIVLALGTFTLTLFTLRRPKRISVDVSDKGIVIDRMLYPYHTLDAFGLDETGPNGPKLMLKSKKVMMPLIAVPLGYENIEELRQFLLTHLKEDVFEPGLLQTLLERVGF